MASEVPKRPRTGSSLLGTPQPQQNAVGFPKQQMQQDKLLTNRGSSPKEREGDSAGQLKSVRLQNTAHTSLPGNC